MTIRGKVILAILFISVGSRVFNLKMDINAVHSTLLEKTVSEAVLTAGELSASLHEGINKKSEKLILPPLLALMSKTGALYAAVLDGNGKALAHSNVTETGKVIDDRFTLQALSADSFRFRETVWNGQDVIKVLIPVGTRAGDMPGEEFLLASGEEKQARLATLELGLSLKEISALEKRIFNRLSAITAVVLVLITAFILWFITVITKPIQLLNKGTELIKEGNYGIELPVRSNDELGELTRSFNRMSSVLKDTTVSRNYLDSLLRNILDPIIVMDPATKVTKANPAAARLLGYTEEELAAKKASDILSVNSRTDDNWCMRAMNGRDTITSMDASFRTKTGQTIPILLSAAPLKDETGHLNGLVAVAKDITEHRKTEATMARLATIVQSSSDVILATDAEGKITNWNPAAQAILGYSTEEIVGKPASILETADSPGEVMGNIEKLKRGENVQYDCKRRRKDGTVIELSVAASAIKDGAGKILGFSAIFRDMTEHKKIEAVLLQSEKLSAIGRLAAGVAHEINNPLGIILGFAQSVTKRVKDTDPLSMPLKTIEREALRCKNLVQNLLVFSRTSKSDQRETMELSTAMEGAILLIAAEARTRQVDLVTDMSSGRVTISANRNQLQQVIINLANNAMDAMPKGGTLTISTLSRAERPGYAEIQVRDTGSGIPKEIQKRIFDPFFTTKEVGKGTGLGLSLVYEIVHSHNGMLELESEEGKGSTFTVRLPVQAGTETR